MDNTAKPAAGGAAGSMSSPKKFSKLRDFFSQHHFLGPAIFVTAFAAIGGILWYVNAATTNYSFWDDTRVPANVTVSDTHSIELGLKFRAKVAGKVTGVRFYKGPKNTGTHTGTLWTNTGTKLATVTFTNETKTGWQTAYFPQPINIAAGVAYVISYHAPKGYYSENLHYFEANDLTKGVLFAPHSTSTNLNGVYADSNNTTFPTQSSGGPNYWVDVVFQTNAVGAAAAPSPPTNLQATQVSGGVQLSWQAAESAAPLSNYVIFRNGVQLTTVSASTLSYVDKLVTAGSTYSYYVEAEDNAGAISAPSTIATITYNVIPPTSSCGHAAGPFTIHGTTVLQSNGQPYIPYGVTLSELQLPTYASNVPTMENQIAAADTAWCSNTVRFQIEQDMLVGKDGNSYSANFMNTIKTVVSYAESRGLVVVLNDQTEAATGAITGDEPLPTKTTEAFWSRMSSVYGKDPQVIFDLFNEPRPNGVSSNNAWNLWKNGGKYKGKSYVSMQAVVNSARSDSAKNLFWVEGIDYSDQLDGVGSRLLRGGPIEYTIHHPSGSINTSTWNNDFGYLVNKGIAPVAVGEWANYAKKVQASGGAAPCWPDAPKQVPEFLKYLASKHIGMTAWTLRMGYLNSDSTFTNATTMTSHFKCSDGLNQGSGSLIQNWFYKQNGSN